MKKLILLATIFSILFIFSNTVFSQEELSNKPIPSFSFPENIIPKGFKVTEDTRSENNTNGKIIGVLNIDFPVNGTSSKLEIPMTATWTESTKSWEFKENGNVPLKGTSITNVSLTKINGKWNIGGDVKLPALTNFLSANGDNNSSSTANFTWLDGNVSLKLPKSIPELNKDGMTLNIQDALGFKNTNGLWEPIIQVDVNVFNTSLVGQLTYENSTLNFVLDTDKSSNNVTITDICNLQFSKFEISIGSILNINANASLSTISGSNTSDFLPNSISTNISGTPGSLKFTALKKQEIPSVKLGKGMSLTLWPVALQQVESKNTTKYNWDITSTLTIAGNEISGNLAFEQKTIKIKNLNIIDNFPKLDFILNKTDSNWAIELNQNLTSDQINPFVKSLGLGEIAKGKTVPILGSVAPEDIVLNFNIAPTMPSWTPSWFKGATDKFTLTHNLTNNNSVINFIVKDIDISKLPGILGQEKVDFSVITGKGVSAPVKEKSNSTPWFVTSWQTLGANSTINKFNWYNAETTSSNGLAFGFADTTKIIKTSNLNGATIKNVCGGGSKEGWSIIGDLNYPLNINATNPIAKVLPTSADLIFTYDGNLFTATNPINKEFSLIPQLGINLQKLKLSHGKDKIWKLSAISELDLFDNPLPGEILIPTTGDPSFVPTIPNGGVSVSFPGAFDPVFKTLNITLGSEYKASGTAVIKKQRGNIISEALTNDIDLNFNLTKNDGWSLATDTIKTPNIVDIPLGKDAINIKSLHIARPEPTANLEIGGAREFTFGNNSVMDATFEIDQTTTTVTIPNFKVIEGLQLKAIAKIIGSGSGKTYEGNISGSVSQSNINTLYKAFLLEPLIKSPAEKTTVVGSFSGGDIDITFNDLPAINGLADGLALVLER